MVHETFSPCQKVIFAGPMILFKVSIRHFVHAQKSLIFGHTSVQFSSVVLDYFRPHGLQHARLPCPSPAPGGCLNSCPSSKWYHPTISSSVTPFSSCLQSFPVPGSFLMSQLFASGGQRIGASASGSVLPMNIQSWFPLGLTGLISWCPRGSQKSSPAPQFESISSLVLSLRYGPTLTSVRDYWKNHSFDCIELCWQNNVSAFKYAVQLGCDHVVSWTVNPRRTRWDVLFYVSHVGLSPELYT